MSIFRRNQWVVLLLAAAMVASACGADVREAGTKGTSPDARERTGGEDGRGLTIAFVGAQTGDNANLGINISNGIQLALDEANARNDLPQKIRMRAFDTQGLSEQAAVLTEQVISDDSVVAIIGPAFSGESKAAIPAFDQAGVPLITPATSPTLSESGWKVFHRIVANDTAQGTETAEYIAKGLRAASVAYIHDNSEYGTGLVGVVRAKAERLDVRTALFDAIDPKAHDYSAAVNKVKASKTSVVYYAGYYAEAGRFAKQLRDAGVRATFLSGDACKDPGFIEAAGPLAAEGAEITCPCADPVVSTDPSSVAFTKAYTKEYGKAPGAYSAEGYDAANILIAAIKAGNTTRETILRYLNVAFPGHKGITKEVSFTPTGEITTGDVYVYGVQGGKITVKGPTAELAP